MAYAVTSLLYLGSHFKVHNLEFPAFPVVLIVYTLFDPCELY